MYAVNSLCIANLKPPDVYVTSTKYTKYAKILFKYKISPCLEKCYVVSRLKVFYYP